jgi:hypothetical protein
MKKILLFSLAILCLLPLRAAFAQSKDSLRYEVMLNANMMDSTLKKERFIASMEISPDKFITLSTGDKLCLLGWGGISQLGNKIEGNPVSSFAFTKDSLLMAIRNDVLCHLNSKGDLDTLVRLPRPNMGIAAGKEVMYLFDQYREDKQYRLYGFAKGGKYKQLLVSPKPITTVVEMTDSLYLAIGSGVFSYSPKTKALNLVAGFQKESEIRSMAVDSKDGILYIATQEGIYALRDNSLVYVTGDFGGGIIRYFNGGLVIFNPVTCDIIRIVNIGQSIKF